VISLYLHGLFCGVLRLLYIKSACYYIGTVSGPRFCRLSGWFHLVQCWVVNAVVQLLVQIDVPSTCIL